MNKYQEGKIYKIVCNITGEIYIGSTCSTLRSRLKSHKDHYLYSNRYTSAKPIILRGDYKIELICHYPCNNKTELRRKEGYYQLKLDCVNKIIAGRTREEWEELKKEHLDTYRKKYRKEHKTEAKKYHDKYRKENRKKLLEQKKEYYQKTKHISQAEIKCDCGGTYKSNSGSKNRHVKTKKHIKFIETGKKPVDTRPRFICDCGGSVLDKPSNRNAHMKKKKHLDYLNTL